MLALILVGLCMGSFIEAASWRWHQLSSKDKLTKQRRTELSMTKGRSMCARCGHRLAWYDLMPLLSWLLLRGKCRYCRKPIGWQAPTLELATAGLFVLSYLNWPLYLSKGFSLSWVVLVLWLVALVHFVFLSVYDVRWMLLPNRVVVSSAVVSLGVWGTREVSLGFYPINLLNVGAAVLALAGVFWVLYQVSDGMWIGGGDVKLGVALGILAGEPVRAFLIMFLASLIGSIVGVFVMIRAKNRKVHIPFGPFLMAATVVVYLFGGRLIEWYVRAVLG